MKQALLISVLFCGIAVPSAFAQDGKKPENIFSSFSNARKVETSQGTYIVSPRRAGCKNFEIDSLLLPGEAIIVTERKENTDVLPQALPFVAIHGNVTYNFNYRSYLDTPFVESDLMQHTVQTHLNMKIRDQYPFTVYLNGRYSNSPFFSNESDISVQFRQSEMLEDIKKKMRGGADSILYNKAMVLTPAQIYKNEKAGVLADPGNFSGGAITAKGKKYIDKRRGEISKEFKERYEKYKSAADRLEALGLTPHRSPEQEAVEAKEKKLRQSMTDSLKTAGAQLMVNNNSYGKADSLLNAQKDKISSATNKYDSLKNELAKAEKELKTFQKKIIDSLQHVKKQIAAIKDKNGLYDYFREKGESVQGVSGLQKALLSVRQIGIGRTWIDYSELTVKNISLTGGNIEANPGKIYFAAAAGKVNYRFRDYIVKGSYTGSGQSVALLRGGFGRKDGNNFIVTYYSGKKALVNQTITGNPVRKISGFSVESRAALDANNYVIGEYARSLAPGIPGKLLSLNTHNNEAWGVKLFSNYRYTKFSRYFRRMGEGFQSFTLYPTNSRQDAWLAKLAQSFWKKRIAAEASVRKNDFISPIAIPDYSSKSVFKSFQVSVRVPKYPFVMVGYYPSSQLVLSDNKTLYENRYNTLNGVVSHSYLLGKLSMNSNVCFTRFYNQGSDTGFIYYNASTVTLNHSVNLKKFELDAAGTLTEQTQLHQLTLEPGVTWRPKTNFSLSSSVKWSRVNHEENLWGGTAGVNWLIKKLGSVQLRWEKIWLPGYSRKLLPVDIGRVTYSREF